MDVRTWTIEVGLRAALWTETRPRDERWWRNLAERAGWLR